MGLSWEGGEPEQALGLGRVQEALRGLGSGHGELRCHLQGPRDALGTGGITPTFQSERLVPAASRPIARAGGGFVGLRPGTAASLWTRPRPCRHVGWKVPGWPGEPRKVPERVGLVMWEGGRCSGPLGLALRQNLSLAANVTGLGDIKASAHTRPPLRANLAALGGARTRSGIVKC